MVIGDALDVNPELTRDLIASLDGELGEAIAKAINSKPDFLVALLADLDSTTGAAMAEGTNINSLEGRGFLENMLRYLDPSVAEAAGLALETNPDLLVQVVGNLKAETGERMAEAQNANPEPHARAHGEHGAGDGQGPGRWAQPERTEQPRFSQEPAGEPGRRDG